MEKCCDCTTLSTCGLIVGYVNLLFDVISSVLYVVFLTEHPTILEYATFTGTFILALLFFMCVYGMDKNKHEYILPYLILWWTLIFWYSVVVGQILIRMFILNELVTLGEAYATLILLFILAPLTVIKIVFATIMTKVYKSIKKQTRDSSDEEKNTVQ